MVGSQIDFGFKPSSKEVDIIDIDSIEKYIEKLPNISCIIHLVATNLRESEHDHKKAINININGTINMLNIAKKYNIPFILLSTGAIFSSNNNNIIFDENFKPCPNSIYGITKLSSEKIALLYDKTILIRTGWLFGGNQKTHYKFVENVINNLNNNNEIKASDDFYGSPTYVIDLINHMKYLIINLKYGIHHVVNNEKACGYDIALEISKILKKSDKLIIPVNSNLIPNSGPERSKSEILESIYSYNKLRNWKESLYEYINNIYKNNIIVPIEKIYKNRGKCRLCENNNLKIFFSLEDTPQANHFILTPIYQEKIPLNICICLNCKHIQLIEIINPEYQYSNYFYVSSTSSTMVTHLKNSVINFTEILNLSKTDNILEIGANDGICIEHLLNNGFINIIGIDPATNIHKRHNLPIICDFFGSKVIPKLKEKYNSFKLIYAFHCCAHIENIKDIFETIYKLLDDNGTFIMEVGYFYEVYNKICFDTIYHEHIDYHTTTAIQKFGLNNNLILYKIQENSIQGGSIQFYFRKNIEYNNIKIDESVYESLLKESNSNIFNFNKLIEWQKKIIQNGTDIYYILNSLISYGKKICGYGASAKSTTFLHQYKLTNKMIDFIIDDNIYKYNHYSPGLHIPIKPFCILEKIKIDYIIILSWNFKDDIINKLEKYRNNNLRIIVPFPEIQIL